MTAFAFIGPVALKWKARRLIAVLCCLLVVFTAVVTLMIASGHIWQMIDAANLWHQKVSDHPKAMDTGYHDRYILTCDTQSEQDQSPALLTVINQRQPRTMSSVYSVITMSPMVHDTILYLSKNSIGSSE